MLSGIKILKDGDILVALDSDEPAEIMASEKETFKHITRDAFHGMIFKEAKDEKSTGKNTILHSSNGYYANVTTHNLFKILKLSPDTQLPATIVFHCQDSKISQNLSVAAEHWVSTTLTKDSSSLPKEQKMPITPFASSRNNDEDTPAMLGIGEKYELYRAFRAHMRNHAVPVLPLSKNKGASCSNFLGYSLKVAIIDRLFPDGMPEVIQKKLLEIENIKVTSKSASSVPLIPSDGPPEEGKELKIEKPITKLTQINAFHPSLFAEFEALVLAEYAKISKKPERTPTETKEKAADTLPREQYLRYLYSPLKTNNIQDFCRTARKSPDLFEGSYLFFVAGELSEANYQKLLELKPTEHGAELFAKLTELKPGPVIENGTLEIMIGLLDRDQLDKESRTKLQNIVEQILTPLSMNHETYLNMLEKNGLDNYNYVVSEHVFKQHLEKVAAPTPHESFSP